MISAIIYTSNTGFTEQYAKLLSEKTGLSCRRAGEDCPAAGEEVIYMGWLKAGSITGLGKAASKYNIRAVCAVGMGQPTSELQNSLRSRHKLCADTPLFCLQGGMDINKLRGISKLIIKAVNKKIASGLRAKPELTEGEKAMLQMATVGGSEVKAENLSGVIEWYDGVK